MSLPLCLSLVRGCGWLGSCFCVPECHHECCFCLHSHLIYFFLNAFRIFYSAYLLSKSVFGLLTSSSLCLTQCNVIGFLYNNKDVIAYTTSLAAWLQVCFYMNELWTNVLVMTMLYIHNCHTYGHGLFALS